MQQVTGVCRFCGQSKMIEVPERFTEEEVTEEVSRNCHCVDAKYYREKMEEEERIEASKLSAKGTTFELFHEEYPEVEELLNSSLDALVDKKIKKITVTTYGKSKATISFSKDTIKVLREDKSTYSRETEV